jgi:phosphoglycerate dehydrogenase-like enzyme
VAGVLTVCVAAEPDHTGLEPLPDGVRVVVWDGLGEPPDGVADTQFFVAEYGGRVTAAALARMPRLQVIQLLSAGVEPWLDLVPDGVTLCSGRGVHGGSTAELAVAGLISLRRRLPAFYDAQRERRWAPVEACDLDGVRALVLGAGDIGHRIAAALTVFDAEVTLVARTRRDGVRAMADLPALLPDHDILAIAVPATPETIGLVDAAFLSAMPGGATLVNVARGQIVDTEALLGELTAGRLSAFLDVTDPEPLPPEHPLWRAPNVLITPHVGGGTRGWQRRGYRLVREQIARFVVGQPRTNVVAGGY